uniref:Uncharacterized protein n=1 Tax=Oryza meridionalis TaxID=40149 RepID=A0A0E0EHZ6_9ORYZ
MVRNGSAGRLKVTEAAAERGASFSAPVTGGERPNSGPACRVRAVSDPGFEPRGIVLIYYYKNSRRRRGTEEVLTAHRRGSGAGRWKRHGGARASGGRPPAGRGHAGCGAAARVETGREGAKAGRPSRLGRGAPARGGEGAGAAAGRASSGRPPAGRGTRRGGASRDGRREGGQAQAGARRGAGEGRSAAAPERWRRCRLPCWRGGAVGRGRREWEAGLES